MCCHYAQNKPKFWATELLCHPLQELWLHGQWISFDGSFFDRGSLRVHPLFPFSSSLSPLTRVRINGWHFRADGLPFVVVAALLELQELWLFSLLAWQCTQVSFPARSMELEAPSERLCSVEIFFILLCTESLIGLSTSPKCQRCPQPACPNLEWTFCHHHHKEGWVHTHISDSVLQTRFEEIGNMFSMNFKPCHQLHREEALLSMLIQDGKRDLMLLKHKRAYLFFRSKEFSAVPVRLDFCLSGECGMPLIFPNSFKAATLLLESVPVPEGVIPLATFALASRLTAACLQFSSLLAPPCSSTLKV